MELILATVLYVKFVAYWYKQNARSIMYINCNFSLSSFIYQKIMSIFKNKVYNAWVLKRGFCHIWDHTNTNAKVFWITKCTIRNSETYLLDTKSALDRHSTTEYALRNSASKYLETNKQKMLRLFEAISYGTHSRKYIFDTKATYVV